MLFHKLGMALSYCVVEAGFGAFAHSAIWSDVYVRVELGLDSVGGSGGERGRG
jgi:hypothetical protein